MAPAAKSRLEQVEHIRKRYPRAATLRGGRDIEIRLMGAKDKEPFLRFARKLPPDDLLYLRFDITDEREVDEWLESIHRNRTITLLAWAGNEIIGGVALTHSETDWTRHIGDIRVLFVSVDVRGEGLGRFLAEEIFVIAELLGLDRISSQMTHDNASAQAVFRGLGFESVALLQGFAMARDDVPRDLLVMIYNVRQLESRTTG